jgi:DNA-binding SARP family transcriptional activator/tetratricopeptide (TPR) repeat protein
VTADGRVLTLARRQERCLLAILLLDPGRVISVERLAELLWDGDPPDHARRALHTYVARIRSVLVRGGAAEHGVALVSERGGYLLRAQPEAVDAHRFRMLLERALATDELTARERLLDDALALWRGPALENAATDRLRDRLCADLAELHVRAVEESLATGLELGRHRELLPELARRHAGHPVRERLVELHMLALYRDGRSAEALDVYAAARTRLADELGLDPGPALQRLHQAVLRSEPLPAARAAPERGPVRPAQLPSDLTGFAGRADQLDQLDALLTRNASAIVISAIAGTAGVGKTALAVHWAHQVRDRFPDGQLYVNLHGFDRPGAAVPPTDVIRRFLDALDVPPPKIPGDPEAQAALYRTLLAGRRILVVLDNARDPEQVRPLLPGHPGCLTLVTSRNRLTGLVAVDGAVPLPLDLLTVAEARDLLAARLGAERLAAEPAAVDELVERCARLPLALAIAAAHAATQPTLRLAALVAQLRDARGKLDLLTGDDTATDIRAVFSWSYRSLRPPAAQLFRLLGLHPGTDLNAPAAASLAGVPLEHARALLAELTRASLLTEHSPGRYACHDLLQVYAVELAHAVDPAEDRQAALHRILDHYRYSAFSAAKVLDPRRDAPSLPPPPEGIAPEQVTGIPEAFAWFATERRTLLAAIERAAAAGLFERTWHLAWTLWSFLARRGHWHDLAASHRAGLDAAVRMGDRRAEAISHRGLGTAQAWLGRYDEATASFQAALAAYTETGDVAGQAHCEHSLAQVAEQSGHSALALRHDQAALRLYQQVGDRAGLARAYNSIGWQHAQLGDYRQALASCQQALAPFQELGDPDGEAATWDSLGYAHHHLGDHARAVDCYRRALELRRTIGDRYHQASTLVHLGDTQQAAGDPAAARTSWQEALDVLGDVDHPDTAAIRAKLDKLSPQPA